jgi:subtilisin family serine protease
VARAGNSAGGCGVANEAGFVAISTLNDTLGTQDTLAKAVAYAADPAQQDINGPGADVIACSLGPNSDPNEEPFPFPFPMMSVLKDAIDFAVTMGRGGLGQPIFWATDNGNVEVSNDEVCSDENTIAVGRSTRNDTDDDSAFGPELDFLATGVKAFSTRPGGQYGTLTGTSFAAPTAAGVAALILAVRPDLTWQQVRQVMRGTCDKIGGVAYDANGRHEDYGFGRFNAAKALNSL